MSESSVKPKKFSIGAYFTTSILALGLMLLLAYFIFPIVEKTSIPEVAWAQTRLLIELPILLAILTAPSNILFNEVYEKLKVMFMSIDIFKGIRETKERFLGNNPLVKDSTLTLLWVVLLVGFAAIFIMAFGASNIDGKTDSQTAKTLLDYGTAIASYGTAIAAMLSFYIIDTGDEKKVSVRKMAAVIIGITLLLWIGYNYTPYLKEIAANNLNYVAASMLFIFAMGTVISGYVRGKNERAKIQELMNLLKTDKK